MRSTLGDLVIQAKIYTQGQPGDRRAAERLGRCLGWWARNLAENNPISNIQDASAVCPMPANPPKRPFNLPDVLAPFVAEALNVPCRPDLLVKTRHTQQIKYEATKETKAAILRDMFDVTERVDGQTIVVVDDLVLSRATLEAIAGALRQNGAARVIALVATRATKGLMG